MAKFKYKLKKLSEESTIASNSGFVSGGEGENFAAPFRQANKNAKAYYQAGYKKVKEDKNSASKFKYKLVNKKKLNKAAKGIIVKPLWEAFDVETYLRDANINDPARKKFVASRILGFDGIEDKLNQLIPLLQQAKHETLDYYKQNPDSYEIVYGTDLANDYLNDLIQLFKK